MSRLVAFALLLCTFHIHAATGEASQYPFNVPPQPVTEALKAFAERTKLQVVYYSEGIEGTASPGVVGNYTAAEALKTLLNGTGLTYRFLNDHTIAIGEVQGGLQSLSSSTQGAGAIDLAQVGGENSKQTSSDDRNSSKTSSATGEMEKLQEITVTGTHLQRATPDGPVSVTVFNREKIDELGVTNVADILNYLPQQTFSANEQNNFAGTRVVRLRGLGLGTTLVLINGRRTVTSALLGSSNVFDLNTIPLAAVERVEVLSDSASAIYGADAVGGVINIILKNNVEQPAVDLYFGTADAGAEEYRASASIGYKTEKFRGSLIMDYFQRDYLMGEDRDLYANQDYRRFGSIDRRLPLANPGTVNSLTTANLPGLSSTVAAIPAGSTGVGLTPANFTATAGTQNLESINRYQSVVPQAERASVFATGAFDLSSATTAFTELFYVDRKDTRTLPPSFLFGQTVPAGNFNPFGVPVSVSYLFTGVGPNVETADSELLRAVAGLKGEWGTWDWEISALGTREDATDVTGNVVDPAKIAAALATTNPAQAFNVFQDGPGASPAVLASLLTNPIPARYSSDAYQGSGFVRRNLFTLPSGPLGAVFGLEWRKEELDLSSLAVSAARKSGSAFTEFRVPLLGHRRFADELAVTVAGRLDDYDDFGSTFNPQYGAEWRFSETLLVRGSYSTSYRAPPLADLFQPMTTRTDSIRDVLRGNELVPVTVTPAGNPNLDPEESQSCSAGWGLTPYEPVDLRIGASYWYIHQDQRIQRPSATLVLANEAFFPERVVRLAPTPTDIAAGRPGRIQSIDSTAINAGRLKTTGVDASISATIATPLGFFKPSLLTTWVATYDAADYPSVPTTDRVGVAHTLGTIPEWRAAGTLAWNKGAFGLSGTVRYISSYADATAANVPNGRTIGAQALVDLQAALDLGEIRRGSAWRRGLTLRAGATNLTDEAAKFSEVRGGSGYDTVLADLRQRFIYAALSKSF